MARDASIRARITGDNRGLKQALNESEVTAKSWAGRMAALRGNVVSSFSSISGSLGMIGAGAGVTALFKGIIGNAAQLEQTTVAFKILTGSAETARVTLEKLQKLGAETPFEFQELASAGQKLIAFGESADTVEQTLRRIGDVASGVGMSVGELAEIYGKNMVQGRLYAQDINQMLARGIPIVEVFAKLLGVSEEEIKKLASEGKITSEVMAQAFVKMTNEGGKFHGMMQQQSETLIGKWSELKDALTQLGNAFGGPLGEGAKGLIGYGTSFIKYAEIGATWLMKGRSEAEKMAKAMGDAWMKSNGFASKVKDAATSINKAALALERANKNDGPINTPKDALEIMKDRHFLGIGTDEDSQVKANEGFIRELTSNPMFGGEKQLQEKVRQTLEEGDRAKAQYFQTFLDALREAQDYLKEHAKENNAFTPLDTNGLSPLMGPEELFGTGLYGNIVNNGTAPGTVGDTSGSESDTWRTVAAASDDQFVNMHGHRVRKAKDGKRFRIGSPDGAGQSPRNNQGLDAWRQWQKSFDEPRPSTRRRADLESTSAVTKPEDSPLSALQKMEGFLDKIARNTEAMAGKGGSAPLPRN